MKKIISLQKIALLFLTTLTLFACGRICIGKMLSIAKKSMVFRKFACLYATSHKLALLFLTLILVACGGSGGGGSSTPAPNPGGNGGGGGNPDETASTKIRISEATGDEGSMLTFKVIANPTIAKPINFSYSVNFDNSLTLSSATTSDINLNSLTGTSTIATDDSSVTISIATVNDNLREHNETFMVILSDLSPTSDVTFTDNEAIGTILANDDATGIVVIKVADAKASEASSEIIFQVTSAFPAAIGSPFTFGYEVDLNNSSADTDDFAGATNGTANIPASSDSTTISISLMSDTTIEPDETFSLLLTNLSENATIDNLIYEGTILNDDLGEISDATAIIGDEKITLNWTNPDSNLFAGVTIAQTTGSTAPAENCSSGATSDVIGKATSDTITGLTNGTAYSFRICAKSTTDRLSSGFSLPNLVPLPTVDNNGNGLIEIATATELNNMRHNLAGTGYKTSGTAVGFTRGCPTSGCNGYELVNDIINLSSVYSNWNPIGSSSDRFTAIFDGNNNRISGLDISSDSDYVGLFSAMEDATIRNLKLTNIRITGNGNVGALVGDATTGINTLSNIELIGDANQESSNAEIKGAGANVGGLVGYFAGTISDASSSLTVRGLNSNANANTITGGFGVNTGGLVGQLRSGSIQNSNSSGFVSASNSAWYVGGLVGVNNATINNSWASGNVSSSNGINNESYGGLVGLNNATISNSWASGHISSNGNRSSEYGGLVGSNNGGTISKSWASGNVFNTGIGSNNFNYGGLVGRNNGATISNSWASGNVVGIANNYGGLVGGTSGNGSNIIQSWASGAVTGFTVGGLVAQNSGNIQGRNYRLDSRRGAGVNENNSIELNTTTDLANLSGDASGGVGNTASNKTHSEWHAGFGNNPNANATLLTRFCDTNGNGNIDGSADGFLERTPDNTVWVMAPAANNVTTASTDTAGGGKQGYYQIPAIRCIGNTDTERKANIDLQRSKFPTN